MAFIEHIWTFLAGALPVLLLILLILQLGSCSILILNLCTFRRLHRTTRAGHQAEPLVSILIPARNEEDSIAPCVRSLLGQHYQTLEVIVLDDQSEDRTAEIIQQLRLELPQEQRTRLRLISGQPLPASWIGKNYACHQLAQAAQGEYLFFADADTIHQPEMLSEVIQHMQRQRVQLLTAQPEQLLNSPGERLIIPLLNFTIMSLLPIILISLRPEPSLSTGNGQLLCFERTAYQRIGGHQAVKGCILEDVLLARRIKAAGYRMAYVDAVELVQCRMYHSLAEVWSGFSKNLYAFYNYNLIFASGALLSNLLFYVLAPLLLIGSIIWPLAPGIILPALGIYLLTVLMRALLALRFNRRQRPLMLMLSLLHPISILIECCILINSIRWHYRKSGTAWKGRYYAKQPGHAPMR